jgi:hypothetical protein
MHTAKKGGFYVNSRERLTRIFQGKEVDRPALKLWGANFSQKPADPAYKPVYDLALEMTDLVAGVGSELDVFWGSNEEIVMSYEDQPLPNSHWVDRITYLNLPGRKLRSIYRYSTIGEPGYTLERFVKEPEDLRAFLNIKYLPIPVEINSYNDEAAKTGDRGIVIYNVVHAAYAVIRLLGSECFALMCIDERDLITEAVETYGARIKEYVKAVLDSGIRPIFGWVGPELCIPPLVRMKEFEDYVFNIDKPLCDLIHDAGGYVWVHCHGRVGKLLTRFRDMGVDVLNPIEPPPMGDVTLSQAVDIVGNEMGLEGNIEITSLLTKSEEEIRELIYNTVIESRKSDRFIMCQSASYKEYVNPSQQYINNLLLYIKYGLECLTTLR